MINKKADILSRLALLDNAQANKYLFEYVNSLESKIKSSKSNDTIHGVLEVLEEVAFRVPNEALSIIKKILNSKNPLKPTVRRLKGFGPIEGKSHQDLVAKCIDILSKIRYIKPKEVFGLFIKLSLHANSDTRKKAEEALVRFCKYDLRVLEKVNYEIQEQVLQELEKWSEERIVKNTEPLLLVTRELLMPSFEGHSWDYNSLTLKFGGLMVNDHLKEIRKRTIDLLKRAYGCSTNVSG